MASRPRTTGAPARLHAAPREGMAGSSGCPPARPTETEADHHNRTADDAGEQVLRRPRDGLNTVRPRAPRSGRCVLTPPRARRCSKTAGGRRKTLSTQVDGPAPFRNGTTRRSRPKECWRSHGRAGGLERVRRGYTLVSLTPRQATQEVGRARVPKRIERAVHGLDPWPPPARYWDARSESQRRSGGSPHPCSAVVVPS